MLDEALQDKLNQNETVELILTDVFEALETKGYNPINQVVGYLISGDPAYISSYQGARNKIQQIERDEIIEVLLDYETINPLFPEWGRADGCFTY